MGSSEWAIQMLLIFCVVIPGLYVWIKIAEKKGTRYALFISMLCFCLAFPLVFLVYSPTTMLIVLLIAGFGLGGLMLFPTVLLSDVIDEDHTKTNERREGIFNGVSGVIVKSSNAISWLVLGIVLTIFQINRENINPSALTPLGELGLRILIGVIPIFFIVFLENFYSSIFKETFLSFPDRCFLDYLSYFIFHTIAIPLYEIEYHPGILH